MVGTKMGFGDTSIRCEIVNKLLVASGGRPVQLGETDFIDIHKKKPAYNFRYSLIQELR